VRLRVLTVAIALLAVAGCGGAPKQRVPSLPPTLAAAWARDADAIAVLSPCAARRQAIRLRSRVIAAVNARKIPHRYLEPLTSKVNALAAHPGCARVSAQARDLAAWLRDPSS
jgi:hypothetical protein